MHYLCCIILQKGWENCFTNSPTRHHFFQIWSWREMDRVGVTLLIKGSTLCKPITKPEFSRGPRGRAVHTRHSLPTFLRHFTSKELCFFMSKRKRRQNNLSSKLDELLDQMQSPDLSRSISKCANVDAIFICHVGQRKKRQLNIWGQCSRKMDFLTGWFSEGTTGSIFSSERKSSEYFWNSVFWGKWDVDEYHFTNRRECFHTKGII